MEDFERKKYLGTSLRYPLFFLGVMIMAIGGNAYKFTSFPVRGVEAIVGIGFALFVLSMIPGGKKK